MFRKRMLIAAIVGLCPLFASAQNEAAKMMYPHPRPIPAPPGDGWLWVPPVYRTVYDRIWTEPVYQTVYQRVWVPDQYGWRTVCYYENGRYIERQEWGITSPAHYETRPEQVMISPGGWSWGPRQELLSPGHWEWRGQPQPRPIPLEPTPYPSPRSPELAPFSSLWEWPADSKK